MSSPTLPTRVEHLPRPSRLSAMTVTAAGPGFGALLLLVGALGGWWWVFGVGALVALAGEIGLRRRTPFVGWLLRDGGLGPVARLLLRGMAAAVLLARCDGATAWLVVVVVAWVAQAGLAAAAQVGAEAIGWLRRSAVLSRGLELPGLSVPPKPAAGVWAAWASAADVFALLGVAESTRSERGGGVWAGAVATVVLAGTACALVAVAARGQRAAGIRRRLPEAVQAAVERIEPEVLLYHSGDVHSAYQVDAWTRELEQAGRAALVVVRDPAVLRAMAPTTVPAVALVSASAMVGFSFGPRARVALIVGNGRGNIHLFRRHGLAFVFVGHGDSDKATSATPLARLYQQIWVAGPAARRRYERAGVDLWPDAIVEIGRPQLGGLAGAATRSAGSAGSGRTVLYAPTWEGWGDEEYVASLGTVGVAVVRRLLAEPGVRVVYRPHPLTGTRDPSLRAAHGEIVRLLVGAGGRVVRRPVASSAANPVEGQGVDDLELVSEDWSVAAVERARADAAAASTAAFAGAGHLVLADGWPDLLSTFAEADLLLADVSAVVTDWLATGRPLVVLDPRDVDVAAFVASHPSVGAGTVVGSNLSALEPVLADLRSGADSTRDQRDAVAADLLGPRPADPVEPMRAALAALLDS